MSLSQYSSSSPNGPSSNPLTLADTFLKELGTKSETGAQVAPAAEPLPPPNPNTDGLFVRLVEEALGPMSKTGHDPDPRTRYYLVLTGGDKPVSPESIQVMDVTEVIPKGCMLKARAFCSGVAFNYFMNHHQLMKVKLCVIGGRDEEPTATVIDLDRAGNSEMPDPDIIDGLLNPPAMKAMVLSVKGDNLAKFVGRVGEYVATKLGEEKKAKYLKMVQDCSSSTSSGLGGLGSFDSVEIWHKLTLQDRVMEAVMKSVQLTLFVEMPITIDIPSASITHLTPRVGWKAGCSVAQGLKRRPCIPDLNQVVVDLLEGKEAEGTVGEEGNKGKKRKGEKAGVDVQTQEHQVPKTA